MSRIPALWLSLVPMMALAGGLAAQTEEEHAIHAVGRGGRVQVIELGEPGRHALFLGTSLGRQHLGVELLPLTAELRAHFGVPQDRGVMVSRIVADSPAEAAGLAVGDILTTVDGENIESASTLRRSIGGREAGETIELEVWRDGASSRFTVEVAEREPQVLRLEGHRVLDEIQVDDGWQARIQEYFHGDDWQARVRRLENLDWKTVEERMRAVEERLRQLEEQLEQTPE